MSNTPYELAKQEYERTLELDIELTQEEYDNMGIIKEHVVVDGQGDPDCWFQIKRDGWITIDDNCYSDHAICTPDALKELCEWYLGLDT